MISTTNRQGLSDDKEGFESGRGIQKKDSETVATEREKDREAILAFFCLASLARERELLQKERERKIFLLPLLLELEILAVFIA